MGLIRRRGFGSGERLVVNWGLGWRTRHLLSGHRVRRRDSRRYGGDAGYDLSSPRIAEILVEAEGAATVRAQPQKRLVPRHGNVFGKRKDAVADVQWQSAAWVIYDKSTGRGHFVPAAAARVARSDRDYDGKGEATAFGRSLRHLSKR